MCTVCPDYYKRFSCIKEKCRHNCCIGWEIDIDSETLYLYDSVDGDMKNRLKNNISYKGEPHFILGQNERCPFLNRDNLCDIIINLGESYLCNICDNHPRFINEIGNRTEIGIGLCCEAAGRLILSQKAPVKLEISGNEEQSEIIKLRDKIILILQNRRLSINERLSVMLSLFDTQMPSMQKMGFFADFLFSLERLDDEWTARLNSLKSLFNSTDYKGFNRHMGERQYEYEQLTVYFIYRHFCNAFDLAEARAYALFAAFAYLVIYALGAIEFSKNGEFSLEEQIELCRIFSSEIEYSDENLRAILQLFLSE